MALLRCESTVFPAKVGVFTVSYQKRSELVKFNHCPGLGFLHSLQHNNGKLRHQLKCKITSRKLCQSQTLVITSELPQNADFPKYYSKNEKKPFPIPIVELRRAARERLKNRKDKPKGRGPPPRKGLVVKSLVPLAYDVYNARITLINNLKKLLKVVPVHACGSPLNNSILDPRRIYSCEAIGHRFHQVHIKSLVNVLICLFSAFCSWCNEIHVGPEGHPFKSCKGKYATLRKGLHLWTNAAVEDVLAPIESYHLYDRLAKRITHYERFSIPRIAAIVELCIQAGVDIPDYPTKRRRKAIIRINKSEFIDADESDLPDPVPEVPPKPLLTETPISQIVAPSNEDEKLLLAEETLAAWEKMRKGANKLMKMYPVRVCGYCPEVHVGPSGHKAQNCGAHKHQQRNGQHGWQAAVLDDLIPPRYVWHVPDVKGPALRRELKSFYGQAPAVVEICIQAGAAIPEEYKPTMRLDIGIPSSPKEAEMVV